MGLTKREREANAKARARAGMAARPTISRMDEIAAAIDTASLARFSGAEPYTTCIPRAFVSAMLLSVVTGTRWYVNAGKMLAFTGAEDLHVGWDPEAAEAEGKAASLVSSEVHAWAARPDDRHRLFVFDASTKYLPAMAQRIGLPWAREPMAYAYGPHRELWENRYHYEQIDRFSRLVNQAHDDREHMSEVAEICRHARSLLK